MRGRAWTEVTTAREREEFVFLRESQRVSKRERETRKTQRERERERDREKERECLAPPCPRGVAPAAETLGEVWWESAESVQECHSFTLVLYFCPSPSLPCLSQLRCRCVTILVGFLHTQVQTHSHTLIITTCTHTHTLSLSHTHTFLSLVFSMCL